LDEVQPARSGFILFHGCTCYTDVVFIEEAYVERFVGVDRDDLGLVDVLPY
jgi:hypothetical protein